MAVTNLTNQKSVCPTDGASERSLVVKSGRAGRAGPAGGCVKLRLRKND